MVQVSPSSNDCTEITGVTVPELPLLIVVPTVILVKYLFPLIVPVYLVPIVSSPLT